MKRIFPKDPFGWLNPGEIWYPKYKSSQKTAVLAEILKKYKIRYAQKPVMVFSYDYINAKACYFCTYSKTELTLDLSAVDAADATSAAVAYFLPKFIKSENAYFLDGCAISNNPCMGAFIEVLKNGYSPNNIKILSLGTGTKQTISLRSGKASMKWGGLQWFIKGGLIIKLVNASTDSSFHQCEKS